MSADEKQLRPRRGAAAAAAAAAASVTNNKRPVRQTAQEENETGCSECDASGDIICCDSCVRAFHAVCLPPECRPDGLTTSWACPVCEYFERHESLDKLRGVWLQLENPLPVPEFDPRGLRLTRREVEDNKIGASLTAASKRESAEDEDDDNAQGGVMVSHQHLFDVAQKRMLFHKQSTEKRMATALPAGGCINVGGNHQVDNLPLSFLTLQQNGRSYAHALDSRVAAATADQRVVYSLTDWRQRARRLGTIAVPDAEQTPLPPEPGKEHEKTTDKEETMRDEGALDDEEEELERCKKTFVDTKEKLAEFCTALASRWSERCCWPYSEEYALKILYYAGFDSKRALELFDAPNFDFYGVCDPPVRPYFNKWRPSDKRSTYPATPFPPPLYLKAALGPIAGTRTRQQTTFANR